MSDLQTELLTHHQAVEAFLTAAPRLLRPLIRRFGLNPPLVDFVRLQEIHTQHHPGQLGRISP